MIMLFNQMKNYKSFTAIKGLWLTTLFLLSTALMSLSVNAAEDVTSGQDNELVGISYNTIQSDQGSKLEDTKGYRKKTASL